MKLQELRIQNFRSFKDETIKFDDYTCLVGPNGAGKSNVLTALNVLFRNTRSASTDVINLGEEDFHRRNISEPIKITVTFGDLSTDAANDLRAYYRQGKLIFSAVATWDSEDLRAPVVQYGERLVINDFAPFFEKFDDASVADLRAVYQKIREQYSELPSVRVKDQMWDALREFEENHSDLCTQQQSKDQFYGWSKGESRLSPHFQWIYVPAVKDASSEQDEAKATALGQLLDRTIRSRIDFDERLGLLREETKNKYQTILENQKPALQEIATSLETRLKEWAHPDSKLDLQWHFDPSRSLTIQAPLARVSIGEHDFLGEIARLGHGMQRSFIVALLQELASKDVEGGPTLLLGIEEPELYQHPPQARHFARLLEKLTTDGNQAVISTHSPYFISGKGFEAVRMVRSTGSGSTVAQLTYSDLSNQLSEALGTNPSPPSTIMAVVEQILQPSQAELFFAAVPVLVEGLEDVAFVSSHMHLSGRWDDFRRLGCHFVVCAGKTSMSRPLAIARGLSIPTFTVFDADSDVENENERKHHARNNRCLLRLCGAADRDPLPDQTAWGPNFVMWRGKIKNVIIEDVGLDEWSGALENARSAHNFASDVKEKNHLLLSAVLEDLWGRGLQSESLENLCQAILVFANDSYQNR